MINPETSQPMEKITLPSDFDAYQFQTDPTYEIEAIDRSRYKNDSNYKSKVDAAIYDFTQTKVERQGGGLD